MSERKSTRRRSENSKKCLKSSFSKETCLSSIDSTKKKRFSSAKTVLKLSTKNSECTSGSLKALSKNKWARDKNWTRSDLNLNKSKGKMMRDWAK